MSSENNSKPVRGLSARWLALVSTFFIIAITLAPPLQRYFAQSSQVRNLEKQVKESQSQLVDAQKQLALLNDPRYIESQARARLHFIFPGEKQYIVLGAPIKTNNPTPPATDLTNITLQNLPWYSKLFSSITSANNANNGR